MLHLDMSHQNPFAREHPVIATAFPFAFVPTLIFPRTELISKASRHDHMELAYFFFVDSWREQQGILDLTVQV